MKKCIVFDADRTIVDSYMPELLSLQEAIENVTSRKISEEEMKKITSLKNLLKNIMGNMIIQKSIIREKENLLQ